jgi:hypothetical protein
MPQVEREGADLAGELHADKPCAGMYPRIVESGGDLKEQPMPTFKLPLSGDVTQTIAPWTAFLSPIGSQFGLININMGQSSAPAVEQDALSDVGSYGRQLGRIGDALIVLLAHFHPRQPLTDKETAAIAALRDMLDKIADVKANHQRDALRP